MQNETHSKLIRRLLDEKEIAEELHVSIAFLRKDRYGAKTIPFMRLGDLIRYDADRVREALMAREVGGPRGGRKLKSGGVHA
jgi:hypothetical protein